MMPSKEYVHISSIRLPKNVIDFVDERVETHIFTSRSHGILRLCEVAIDEYKHHHEQMARESPKVRPTQLDQF